MLLGGANPRVDLEVRFLQLRSRELPEGGSWQEAADRCVLAGALTVSDLLVRIVERRFAFSGPHGCGLAPGAYPRQRRDFRRSRGRDFVQVDYPGISNETPIDLPENTTRDDASLFALVAAHAVVTVSGGEFVSLIDPPDSFREDRGPLLEQEAFGRCWRARKVHATAS